MQEWWRTVLRLRLFYLRELLLGVLVWDRKLLTTNSASHPGGERKNLKGDQVGICSQVIENKSLADLRLENQGANQTTQLSHQQVTIKVVNYPREQEIFSSDKYQKSVNRGLIGELLVDNTELVNNTELVDSERSTWTAVGVMLEKRRKKLAITSATDQQIGLGMVGSEHLVIKENWSSQTDDVVPTGLTSSKVFGRSSSYKWLKHFKHDKPGGSLRSKPSHKSQTSNKRKSLSYWLSWLLIAGGVIIALTYVIPDLYFKIVPADVIRLGEVKGSQNEPPTETQATPTPTPTPYIPPIDPDLPAGQWLTIPEIGVKTQPKATEDPEVALKDGVWIAPEYGQIGQPGMPIIMAAHRFGWKWWWQSDYWKLNSFYNLPETKPGTIVELIADQRKWTYLIYGGEEGDAITDYGADLILYTCKFLNSPIRHIRYARLIDPTRPEVVLNQDNRPLSEEEKTELGKLFSLPY